MKIKTSELTGRALDWCVAKSVSLVGPWKVLDGEPRVGFVIADERDLSAEGRLLGSGGPVRMYTMFENGDGDWRPSSNWEQGGPLIDRYEIALVGGERQSPERRRCAHMGDGTGCGYGLSNLVAAMRAIVAAKLGEEVDVPVELVKL